MIRSWAKIRTRFLTLLLACLSVPCLAQINTTCTVSILNRTANANSNGSYEIFNVPAGLGKARVRATCIDSAGNARYGHSPYINILPDIGNGVGAIKFEDLAPTLKTLSLLTPSSPLHSVTDTIPVTAQATFSNDSTANVTLDPGITYRSTNPAIARIDSTGKVTAVSSGRALILAMLDRTLASAWVTVQLGNDVDGDGLPDDFEAANGLNPNDPLDAMEDIDLDGLTALQEFQFGTQLRLADTDGDGIKDGEEVVAGKDGYVTQATNANTDGDPVPDGLEVQFGTDPTNAQSYNLAAIVTGIEVQPSIIGLVFNTALAQEAFRQLRVIGTLRNGGNIDLTDRALGTTYTSSNLQVANFGPESGRIYAGMAGQASIAVRVGSFQVNVPVTVESFSPQVLTTMALSGTLSDVEVQGALVLVSAGAAGVHILDASNPSQPVVMSTFNTAGYAYDLKVRDTVVYVADGTNGLVLIGIQDPVNPVLLATFDTPGTAQDMTLQGNRIYVADGASGVSIIDIANPRQPNLVGTLFTEFAANAVAADDSTIAVAEAGRGVELFQRKADGAISRFGRMATTNALDVELDRGYVFVADYNGSLRVIDPRDRNYPRIVASMGGTQAGYLLDLAIHKDLLFGADIFFVNGVPLVDVANPENPLGRTTLNFPGDATGVGVAADDQFVFMVADNNRLHVGQYARIVDMDGQPPTVEFISPVPGQSLVHGESLDWEVRARDDIGVRQVSFQINGIGSGTDKGAPYRIPVILPSQGDSITLAMQATDFGDNQSPWIATRFVLGPDPGTNLNLIVVSQDSLPAAGAVLRCGDSTWQSDSQGMVTGFYANTISGPIHCSGEVAALKWFGTTSQKKPVRGGVTEFGTLILAPIPRVDAVQPRYVIASGLKQVTVTGLNFIPGTVATMKPMEAVSIPTPTLTLNSNGTEAALTVTVPANAFGSFVVVFTSSAGQSDTLPRKENIFRVLANGTDDLDKDELTNAAELTAGTDPLLWDTDGDGFGDGFESANGTNPLLASSIPVIRFYPSVVQGHLWGLANGFDPTHLDVVPKPRQAISPWVSFLNGVHPREGDTAHYAYQAIASWFALLNSMHPQTGDTSTQHFHISGPWLSLLNATTPMDTSLHNFTTSSPYLSLLNLITPQQMGNQVHSFQAVSLTHSIFNSIMPPAGLNQPGYPDTDGDGLSDIQEAIHGTDPWDYDSDNDGVPDGLEVARGTNPKDANSHSNVDVPPLREEAASPTLSIENQ